MEMQILKKTTIRQQIADIVLDVSWAKIAHRYFGKPCSWLYGKLDAVSVDACTSAEKQQLKTSLYDLSERIKTAANNIE